MFEHLRFAGATVVPKTNPGVVARELLDLNDPETVAFRQFIIETIETWLEKKAELLSLKRDLLKLSKRSVADAAHAAAGLHEIEQKLAQAENNLKQLSGDR